MDFPQIYVCCVAVAAFVMFLLEILAVDLVAVIVVLALVFGGVLESKEALAGFGHPAVIGVGALFLVSEGLLRTGALNMVARRIETMSGGSVPSLTVLVLLVVAVSSAFLNNTPVVAMFIPVIVGLAARMKFNPSKLLIPVSFAAILGGTCTLIGTSTNIIVATRVEGLSQDAPGGPMVLTMFEFTKMGVIFVGVGVVYLVVIGRRLVPVRETISSMTAGGEDRRLREYATEILIRPGSSLIGKKFGETALAEASGVRVLQLIRGETIIWPPLLSRTLRAGDALIVAGKIQHLMDLHEEEGVTGLGEILSSEQEVSVSTQETELAEVLVQPYSNYIDQTLEEARFRNTFGVKVLAIQRHGMHLRKKLSEHPLRVGDLLLVQGTPENLRRMGGEEGLVLMSGVDDVVVWPRKAPVAIVTLVGLIGMLAFQSRYDMATVATAAAMIMILTRCLPVGKVYDAIHWRVLVLIAGTLALGTALQKTGAANVIAESLVDWFQVLGPRGIVVVVLVLSALLTEMVSNVAVAALMTPIAYKIASAFPDPLSPYPFVMAVAYGASCSFLTPIGYQTNTLVYGAGGYRFSDFFRVGAPLVLLIWILGGLMIPVFWPL